ncbi:Cysteine-rich receptor-like protein kinase 24 [Vitis vinifera]|uniref:Cysteine-rich receptor-like protein kinase 24 n=1 Tax=Vitis vinifera TaxID=29760 RepID=A0A438DA81_VITVI|nr:Cysteine-rich receptor-like protein kinase 24 [Vitis vinifera]
MRTGPRGYSCDGTTYYAPNSTFSSNLDTALQTLQNTTASSGFATTTSGSINQTVTALALCRATINPSDCQLCIDVATSGIRNVCPNGTAAQVWYTLCMLRYSHRNFVNKTDYTLTFSLYDTRNAPDPDIYDAKVQRLMQNLSSTAGASEKRYAVGRTTAPENFTLYGYVDCTRDIDGDSCKGCLLATTRAIDSCCLGQWAGWLATPTCNIQFNMDPVHEDWVNGPYINTDITPSSTLAPLQWQRMMLEVVVWKRDEVETGGSEIIEDNEEMSEGIGKRSFMYDLEVLVAATGNFCWQIGWVLGMMADGEEIAVKKLAPGSTQGREEFSNEVRLLLKLQHRNLVRLFGCCVEGENRLLVYEYLQNKSLDHFIFDKSKSALLDWPKRYNIIIGQESKTKMFYSGYMAPEYATRGFMSSKIDAWRLEEEGQLTDLVDVTIGSFPQDQVLKCIRIGLLCCQQSIRDRPTMSSTVLMLSNDSVTMPIEGTHGYQNIRDPVDPHNNINALANPENESFSKNSITFSSAKGR